MDHPQFVPTNQPLPPSTGLAMPSPHTDYARKRAKLLLSSYPRDDYADPDGFAMQLTAILADYRAEVIDYATSPLTGIQRKVKFRLTLAEVVSACDEHARHLDFINRPKLPPALARHEPQFRQNYNDLTARYGRPVGVFEPGREFPYEG